MHLLVVNNNNPPSHLPISQLMQSVVMMDQVQKAQFTCMQVIIIQ